VLNRVGFPEKKADEAPEPRTVITVNHMFIAIKTLACLGRINLEEQYPDLTPDKIKLSFDKRNNS